MKTFIYTCCFEKPHLSHAIKLTWSLYKGQSFRSHNFSWELWLSHRMRAAYVKQHLAVTFVRKITCCSFIDIELIPFVEWNFILLINIYSNRLWPTAVQSTKRLMIGNNLKLSISWIIFKKIIKYPGWKGIKSKRRYQECLH